MLMKWMGMCILGLKSFEDHGQLSGRTLEDMLAGGQGRSGWSVKKSLQISLYGNLLNRGTPEDSPWGKRADPAGISSVQLCLLNI